MTIRELNVTATIARRIDTKRPTVTYEDDIARSFGVRLDPPTSSGSGQDASPRRLRPYVIQFTAGVLGLRVPLLAGCRLTFDRRLSDGPLNVWEANTYEVLADARPLRRGSKTLGWTANVQALSTLYPLVGQAATQGDGDRQDIHCALWTSTEVEGDHGDYEDYNGEAPIEAADALMVQNARILVDDTLYRVMTATIDYEGPRVRFTARRTRG